MCRIQTFEDSCYNNKQYFSRKSDGFMSDSRGGGGGRMILLYNSHHMAIIFKGYSYLIFYSSDVKYLKQFKTIIILKVIIQIDLDI